MDAPWTALGGVRGSVGRSGGSWSALCSSSGFFGSSGVGFWAHVGGPKEREEGFKNDIVEKTQQKKVKDVKF